MTRIPIYIALVLTCQLAVSHRPKVSSEDDKNTKVYANYALSAAGISFCIHDDAPGTCTPAIEPSSASTDAEDYASNAVRSPEIGPPNPPTLVAPPDGSASIPANPTLSVVATEPDGNAMEVVFYGRAAVPAARQPFSIVILPDTQFYAASFPQIFATQTQWIVNNREELNIAYVAHLGDLVDDANSTTQWDNVSAAMELMEDPATTTLPHGIPYGTAVGNHDQWPLNDPGTLINEGATTSAYNRHFGVCRFSDRDYYGGHYGNHNDNHYDIFTASGLDFIAVYLEYDPTDSPLRQTVINWAETVLDSFSDRRGIIVSHFVLDPASDFSDQGQALYDAFKFKPNVFMMLGGHLWYAAQRSDTYDGSTIYTMLSNYQAGPNGGDGWLRILTFSPEDGEIRAATYSPWLDQYDPTSEGQFTFPYNQSEGPSWTVIGSVQSVASGSVASVSWPGRRKYVTYEWYAAVSNDNGVVTEGPRWSFTSDGTCGAMEDCSDGVFCTGEENCEEGICVESVAPCSGACAQCNEEVSACTWCVFDVDRNGWIASGDFGFFAGCYGACYPLEHSCSAVNFDRSPDGCVGSGDFGVFAACYSLPCHDCTYCCGSPSADS